MSKLLNANFSRLWKSRVFWLGALAVLIISIGAMLSGCRQAMNTEEYSYCLDDFYFNVVPAVGLISSVFISLFLGTEYSDGTIRNKLVVGHDRTTLYLSCLITCCAASFVYMAACYIGGLVGIPFVGTLNIGFGGFVLYLVISIFFTAALAAIFTFIGLASSSKSATTVASILLFLAMLFVSSGIYNSLTEPEMSSGVMLTAQGMVMTEPTPNPDYIGGSLRTVYETILNLLPTGQSILMANTEIESPVRDIVFSVVLAAVVTAAGIAVFRKKDIK